jgi:hypothetical protein
VFAAAVVSWIGLAPGRDADPRRGGRVGWAPQGHAGDAGAYTAVTHDTFLAARPIGARRISLDADEVRRAPVARAPALAPGFNSLGRGVARERPEALPDRGLFERRVPQQPVARGDGPPRNADAVRGRDFQRGGDSPRNVDAPRSADAPRGADAPRRVDTLRETRDARDSFRDPAPVGLGDNPPGAGLRQRLPEEQRRGAPAPVQREVAPAPRQPDPVEAPAQREPLPAMRQPGRVMRDEPVRDARGFDAPREVQRNFEPPRAAPAPSYAPPPAPVYAPAQAPAYRPPPPAPTPTPAPAPQARAPQPAQPGPPPDSGRGRRGEREQ